MSNVDHHWQTGTCDSVGSDWQTVRDYGTGQDWQVAVLVQSDYLS